MADSVFSGTLAFFHDIGIYDVVLPFLLTFTLVFAMLEKTKIYGTEKDEKGNLVTRKNLNSMTAFCVAFFVVASTQVVKVINESLAWIVLLLLLSIGFMLLVGSFHSGEKEFYLKPPWNVVFMVIMFIGIIMIFLYSLGWLDDIYDFFKDNASSNWVSGLILIVIIILFMFFVVREPKKSEKKDAGDA